MKVYAIYDEELARTDAIGYLFCYEKSNSYIIELCSDLNEWEAPLLFQGLVKKGIYTIPKDIAFLWVKERVIPNGRQNIGLILKNANIKEYNERILLDLSCGRCAQDSCFINEISENEIPPNIKQRDLINVSECFLTENEQIICLFKDDIACKIDLHQMLNNHSKVKHLLNNKELLHSVKVGVGGYSIVFNDSIEIMNTELRKEEWILPISASVFYQFVNSNIVNSAQACETLECSRQNLSYLLKKEKVKPVIYGIKENFYTKGSIQKVLND